MAIEPDDIIASKLVNITVKYDAMVLICSDTQFLYTPLMLFSLAKQNS